MPSADFDQYLVAPKAEALAAVAAQATPAAVLVSSTAENKEIAARLAIKLGSGVLTDAVAVNADGSVEQSIFGGSITVTSKVPNGVPVIAVRPNSITPEPAATPGTAEVVEVDVPLSDAAQAATVVEHVSEDKGARPALSDASIVVSGGRGIGTAENFRIIEKLADTLGAAVGASRAVVDAGWVPHQMQVGQTGVTVSPQLYIAVGYLRCHPAPGRHANLQDDHRYQQGPRGPNLRTRRLRRRRRSVHGRTATHRRARETQGVSPAARLCRSGFPRRGNRA